MAIGIDLWCQCSKLYRSIASSYYIRCRTEDVPRAWSYNTNALCASGYRQGLYPISAVARQTQNSYEEVVKQDYITMAKAKGISKRTLLFRHILKNAMLPVITYMGPMIAFLLTGSVVIEQIYTIPGIGKEFVSAITNHDYTVVMGITIFIGAIIIICNLLSDLICAVVDPRVRKTL
ncbi:ABC transporter permease [Clostridium sp. AM49-4BH]|nr:ABC transporter permease [Clostridium sp. AM49-4BH]